MSPSFSGTAVTIEKEVEVPPQEQTSQNPPAAENPSTIQNNPVSNTQYQETNNSEGVANNEQNIGRHTQTQASQTEQITDKQKNNFELDSNNNLSTLKLSVEGVTPTFNKDTTRYTLTVSDTTDNIEINAIPESSKAKVNVTGNNNLTTGTNKILITVVAENGSKKEYVIDVTKTENPELANSSLENLAIEFTVLEPAFDASILEYSAIIGSDIDSLNILAVPQREGAIVTITGNEGITYGNNIITINVKAEDRNI